MAKESSGKVVGKEVKIIIKQEELYEKLKKSFPDKAYNNDGSRGFNLTTIDAYHVIDRLNEVFGLCGKGWWLSDIEWIKIEGDKNIVICSAIFCYLGFGLEGEFHRFPCVGGHQVIKNRWDDGYKSAMTNCICKGASFLGVGLNVYKGEFKGKTEQQPKTESEKKQSPGKSTGGWTEKRKNAIEKIIKSHLITVDERDDVGDIFNKAQKESEKGKLSKTTIERISYWIGFWYGTKENDWKDGEHNKRKLQEEKGDLPF